MCKNLIQFHLLSIAFSCASLVGPRALQPANAALPVVSSPSGRVTALKLEQRLKADLPTLVTVLGMATDVSLEHQEKASAPIEMRPSGKWTWKGRASE